MVVAAFIVTDGIVPIGAIVGMMSVVFLAAAVLMMGERHALRACDCRHALDRNGQGQQQHSQKAEDRFRHQRGIVTQSF
jgi:hypothetical protein